MRRLLAVTAIAALLGTVRSAAAADYEVGSSGQGSYLINGQPDPTPRPWRASLLRRI